VFEWLTGCSPFDGKGEELAWQRKNLVPPSMRAIVPEIPAAVERVVLTALQKAPNRRFKTMLDFTLAFEEAYKQAIVRLPYDASTSRSHRMRASHRYESVSRHGSVLRQERSVGVMRQPMFADEGHVLVAQPLHPAPLRRHRIEEGHWDPKLTSDGEEIHIVLPSRLQNFWSMLCNTWKGIAGFFAQKQCSRH
jgi:hypothetical protein